jgi:hypothetical protein
MFNPAERTPAFWGKGKKGRDRMGRDHSSTPRSKPTPAAVASFLTCNRDDDDMHEVEKASKPGPHPPD